MIIVRDVILKVNKAYILSAAQADEYRTEPPFKLQGSYRNMNRITEKIVPIMNDEELTTLVLSHYENEAQTLTTGTEANLLKFKELTGWLNDDEEKRWHEIKKGFKKIQLYHGADAKDPVNRVVAQLSAFQDGLDTIGDVLSTGIDQVAEAGKAKESQENAPSEISISEQTMTMMREMVAEGKAAIMASVEKEKPGEPLLPPKVEVVSRIPKAILKIIQMQFDMMHTWMSPALNETYRQSDEIEKITEAINQLKVAYKGVIREKGDFDEAIVYYNKAIEMDSNDAESYYNRGLAWYNKKDTKQALSDVKNALSLNPENKKYQRFVTFLETEVVSKP
ncbi:MAG: tetratricopeptide repeat protein, partial [Desulfobacterales bacterium]|nr:tetratricopeptide repeat protein [Desulfobacterales bacterium]